MDGTRLTLTFVIAISGIVTVLVYSVLGTGYYVDIPQTQTVYENKTVKFSCVAEDVPYLTYFVNGVSDKTATGGTIGGITTWNLTLRATLNINGSEINCCYREGPQQPWNCTDLAHLYIQGLPGGVGTVNATVRNGEIVIEWDDVFSLNVTNHNPDVWYQITITKTDTDFPSYSSVETSMFVYRVDTPNMCFKYHIEVVPVNGVGDGPSNSTEVDCCGNCCPVTDTCDDDPATTEPTIPTTPSSDPETETGSDGPTVREDQNEEDSQDDVGTTIAIVLSAVVGAIFLIVLVCLVIVAGYYREILWNKIRAVIHSQRNSEDDNYSNFTDSAPGTRSSTPAPQPRQSRLTDEEYLRMQPVREVVRQEQQKAEGEFTNVQLGLCYAVDESWMQLTRKNGASLEGDDDDGRSPDYKPFNATVGST